MLIGDSVLTGDSVLIGDSVPTIKVSDLTGNLA